MKEDLYIKQKDDYSCVPVAIHNAVRWAGNTEVGTSELLDQLRLICDTKKHKNRSSGSKKGGTTSDGLRKGLASRPELKIAKEMSCPSIKDIKWHLDKGGAVILCYKHKNVWYSGHATFIDQREGNMYRIVNGRGTSTEVHKWEDNKYLRSVLNRKAMYGYKPHAWFVYNANNPQHLRTLW
jgi:hypothetical protein